MKKTKRALLFSAIAIVLCLVMLAGTTFAWFSDTASNKNNRIQSGTLNIGVIGYNLTETQTLDIDHGIDFETNDTPLIDESNWEPGLKTTKYIAIYNYGSLEFKFKLDFTVLNDNDKLSEALWYKFQKVTALPDGTIDLADENDTDVLPMTQLESASTRWVEHIPANANPLVAVYRLDYGFYTTAGNSYQGLNTFSADINVIATQDNTDAVGDPDTADVIKVSSAAEFMAAVDAVNEGEEAPVHQTITLTKDITLAEAPVFTDYCNIDINGYTLTGNFSFDIPTAYGTIDLADEGDTGTFNGTITINTPNGVVNAYGAYVPLDNDADAFNIIAVANNSFHFFGTTSAKITVATGRVVIENSAILLSTASIVVPNSASAVVEVEPMATVSEEVEIEIDNQPVNISTITLDEYTLNNPTDLVRFADKINSKVSVAGKTIKLGADIDLSGILWDPIVSRNGQLENVIIDGCGYTISNLKSVKNGEGCFTGYGGGFIADISANITIKNITFDNAYVAINSFDIAKGNIVGIVMGYTYGTTVFENVNVINSKVTGFGKVGAILGMGAEPGILVTFKGCTSKNNIIKGCYNMGGLAGNIQRGSAADKTIISDCVVEGNQFVTTEQYDKFTNVASSIPELANGNYWKYISGSETYYYGGYAKYYISYGVDVAQITSSPYQGCYLSAGELCIDTL